MAERAEDRQAIEAAAAVWVARLAEPDCSDADRAAFDAWRSQGLDYLLAYERMAAAWGRLDRARALRPASPRPDADALAPRAGRRTRAWGRFPLLAASMLLALAVATVIVEVLATPAYATTVGERRTVVLGDGDRLELNTDSKVVVHRRLDGRTFDLVRGEAVFRIAPRARPVLVRAGAARLRIAEGDLHVRLMAGGAALEVLRGQAEAGTADAPRRTVRLRPGVEGLIGQGGPVLRTVAPGEVTRGLAWRQGAISLDGTPLGEAAAEFNRYNRRELVIADPAVAALRVSGYFDADDVAGFVRALERTFPLRAVSGPDERIRLTWRES